MSDKEVDVPDWDPGLTERVIGWIRPIAKRYFRFEVRGLQSFPPGAALVVSNHSGGLFTLDVTAFASEFYAEFGYDRPVYTLSDDMLLNRVTGSFLTRIGFIRADRDCAAAALGAGGVVMVFPGGDYDVYRPTLTANTIDFDGRTGYVRTALEAGVPIVPAVSIGGQETQFFLSRGMWLANRLRLGRLVRSKVLPISIGVPFGLSLVLPINMPLPAKIVTQVLATDRYSSPIRRRSRRRRGRRARAIGDAEGSRRAGGAAPIPRARLGRRGSRASSAVNARDLIPLGADPESVSPQGLSGPGNALAKLRA